MTLPGQLVFHKNHSASNALLLHISMRGSSSAQDDCIPLLSFFTIEIDSDLLRFLPSWRHNTTPSSSGGMEAMLPGDASSSISASPARSETCKRSITCA